MDLPWILLKQCGHKNSYVEWVHMLTSSLKLTFIQHGGYASDALSIGSPSIASLATDNGAATAGERAVNAGYIGS